MRPSSFPSNLALDSSLLITCSTCSFSRVDLQTSIFASLHLQKCFHFSSSHILTSAYFRLRGLRFKEQDAQILLELDFSFQKFPQTELRKCFCFLLVFFAAKLSTPARNLFFLFVCFRHLTAAHLHILTTRGTTHWLIIACADFCSVMVLSNDL